MSIFKTYRGQAAKLVAENAQACRPVATLLSGIDGDSESGRGTLLGLVDSAADVVGDFLERGGRLAGERGDRLMRHPSPAALKSAYAETAAIDRPAALELVEAMLHATDLIVAAERPPQSLAATAVSKLNGAAAAQWSNHGRQALLNAYQRGENLVEVFSSLNADTGSGQAAAEGAISMAITICGLHMQHGGSFSGAAGGLLMRHPDESRLQLAYASLRERGDESEIEFFRNALVYGAEGIRGSGGMQLKVSAPAGQAPTPVTVVAMPERATTTTVERDKRDNIISTMQIERDVQPDTAIDGGVA